MTEQEAYQKYFDSCHSEPGSFVAEFSFQEWRENNRPKGLYAKDGYWGSGEWKCAKTQLNMTHLNR